MAKFWLEPIVALASHYGLSAKELSKIDALVRENKVTSWAWRSSTLPSACRT